jgi:hypothetical protein
MRKFLVLFLVFALVGLLLPAAPARAQSPLPEGCTVIPADAVGSQFYVICTPPPGVPPNGDAVVYAHGYVPPGLDPVAATVLQLTTPDGTSIPGMITQLGFVFAASTYSVSGLAVKEGLAETVALAQGLKLGLVAYDGTPVLPPLNRVFLVGASEGGLIATQAMERVGTPFTSGVAACGPIGDFRKQIDYFGDFRVLFDYFFKGVLPGSPINIDGGLFADWMNGVVTGNPAASAYQSAVLAAMQANPGLAKQLIATSKAAIDPNDPTTAGTTALQALGYNVYATMDAQAKLGLQPYTNSRTWYFGSKNDLLLNRTILRYKLSGTESDLALALVPLQTTGRLQAPLVTIHTLYDPQVPIWHQVLYRAKVWKQNKAALYNGIPINRYGDCNFSAQELLFAFALAYTKGTKSMLPLDGVNQALPSGGVQQFEDMMQEYGPVAQ